MTYDRTPPSAEEEAAWHPLPEWIDEAITDEASKRHATFDPTWDAFIEGARWALLRDRYIREVRPEYRDFDWHTGSSPEGSTE